MKSNEIHEAFCTLRQMCDPRGHDILDALENLCVSESVTLDEVIRTATHLKIQATNVIPLIRDYSVKA